jgi:YggT family protein
VNLFACDFVQGLSWVVNAYTLLLFVYAVMSWIPELRRGRVSYYLAQIIEPVLMPIRRVVPPMGGLDLAFLILILILQLVVRPALNHMLMNTCIPIY